ncbi:hypothetical protein DH2020_019323 [Rehmannia glutinosa]|uniref:RING-type domain-containing protein n=1 Tax=Rehmannia glutinosa TaxID=99300 RepID=A0ABR0WP53_REHGL
MDWLLEWDCKDSFSSSSDIEGSRFAAEICTFLRKDCCTVYSCSATLSVPFGLDYHCCQKTVRSGVSLFGCFSAIVDLCALLASWLTRRQAHLLRAQQGIPVSEYGVLVDMVRVPDWAIEAAGQEMRGMGQDAAAYQPGLYLTPAQREAVEALIQELPKFRMKAVPTDCSECPICLEEFHVGNEVRGLPCAHNFHVECIDEWLRLNVKCPRCRCSVFPNLDLSALSNIQTDTERATTNVVTTTQYVRNQTPSQSYLLRLQGLLRPVHTENAGSGSDADSVETPASRGPPAVTRIVDPVEPVQVVVEEWTPPRT